MLLTLKVLNGGLGVGVSDGSRDGDGGESENSEDGEKLHFGMLIRVLG